MPSGEASAYELPLPAMLGENLATSHTQKVAHHKNSPEQRHSLRARTPGLFSSCAGRKCRRGFGIGHWRIPHAAIGSTRWISGAFPGKSGLVGGCCSLWQRSSGFSPSSHLLSLFATHLDKKSPRFVSLSDLRSKPVHGAFGVGAGFSGYPRTFSARPGEVGSAVIGGLLSALLPVLFVFSLHTQHSFSAIDIIGWSEGESDQASVMR